MAALISLMSTGRTIPSLRSGRRARGRRPRAGTPERTALGRQRAGKLETNPEERAPRASGLEGTLLESGLAPVRLPRPQRRCLPPQSARAPPPRRGRKAQRSCRPIRVKVHESTFVTVLAEKALVSHFEF